MAWTMRRAGAAGPEDELQTLIKRQRELNMKANPAFDPDVMIRARMSARKGAIESVLAGNSDPDRSEANAEYLINNERIRALQDITQGGVGGTWRGQAGARPEPTVSYSPAKAPSGGSAMTPYNALQGQGVGYNWGRMAQEGALEDLKQKKLQTEVLEQATPGGQESAAYRQLRLAGEGGPLGQLEEQAMERGARGAYGAARAQLAAPAEHLLSPTGMHEATVRRDLANQLAWGKGAPTVEAAGVRAAGQVGAAEATGAARVDAATQQALSQMYGKINQLLGVLYTQQAQPWLTPELRQQYDAELSKLMGEAERIQRMFGIRSQGGF